MEKEKIRKTRLERQRESLDDFKANIVKKVQFSNPPSISNPSSRYTSPRKEKKFNQTTKVKILDYINGEDYEKFVHGEINNQSFNVSQSDIGIEKKPKFESRNHYFGSK
jgi:hypothetical protein